MDVNGCSAFSFSTGTIATRQRLPYWREAFGRQIVRVEFEPDSDVPLVAACSLRAMPGLRTVSLALSPSSTIRPRGLLGDNDDSLAILIPIQDKLTASQLDREVTLSPGDATLILSEETAAVRHATVHYQSILVPRGAIAPLVKDIESAAARALARGNDALRLLTSYTKMIHADIELAAPDTRALAVTHVQDLVAMVLGATRDGNAIAQDRGVRAARLAAVKADVIGHVGDSGFTLGILAARQKISPRSVQLLFEREGTTFSQFLSEQRLLCAHRMLTDPRHSGVSISGIALASGFGDLSHFYRSFRRRYGATPSDVRAAGLGKVKR